MPTTLANLILENADPAWFWLLVVLVSVVVLVGTYRGIYQRSGRRLTWWLLGLRLAGVAAVLLALVKPAWVRVTQEQERPMVAVVVDTSQSMALSNPSGSSRTGGSRYEAISTWWRSADAAASLRKRCDVRMYDITGRRLDGERLPDQPAAERTDLLAAADQAARDLRGRHTSGIVLISDGCDTTGRTDMLAAESLGLPVFALGFPVPPAAGSTTLDLVLKAATGPRRTLVHNQVTISAVVDKVGLDPVRTTLQLEHAGQVLASTPLELPAGQASQRVALSFTPDHPGDFVLTARLASVTGEISAGNNARSLPLRVDAEPIRVLYLEGVMRTEATFLIEALKRDPDIEVIALMQRGSREAASAITSAAGEELLSEARLEKMEVVIIGDLDAATLGEDAALRLRQWVEKGGGLLVLGGYRNMGADGLVGTPLAEMLPVDLGLTGAGQIEEPVHWRLTAEGKRHPVLVVSGDAERDAAAWESLAGLAGIVAADRLRPAAVVLAESDAIAPSGKPWPVLVVQPFGQGQTALMLADTTWRWSRLARLAGQPDTLYVRLWSQMVRWLARREAATSLTALTVATDAPTYGRGQAVTLTLQRHAAALTGDAASAQPVLSVRRPDGQRVAVALQPSTTPDQWTARFFPSQGGRFEVEAGLATADSQAVASARSEFLVEGSNLETEQASPSPATLRQLARLTGGLYADLDQADEVQKLIQQIPDTPRLIQHTRRATLWNSPALFLLFLLCVSLEWLLRRRNQLS